MRRGEERAQRGVNTEKRATLTQQMMRERHTQTHLFVVCRCVQVCVQYSLGLTHTSHTTDSPTDGQAGPERRIKCMDVAPDQFTYIPRDKLILGKKYEGPRHFAVFLKPSDPDKSQRRQARQDVEGDKKRRTQWVPNGAPDRILYTLSD